MRTPKKMAIKTMKKILDELVNSSYYIMEKLNFMLSEVNRYRQPFKASVVFVSSIILIPLVFALVVSLNAFLITKYIVTSADRLLIRLLKLVTLNQYSELLKEHYNPIFSELKKVHINSIRQINRKILINNNKDTLEWDNISNESIFALLVNEEYRKDLDRRNKLGHIIIDFEEIRLAAEERYNQKIVDAQTMVGFSKLKFIIYVLYRSITKPISEYYYNEWEVLIFLKPLQLIIAPFILGIVSVIELSRLTNVVALCISTSTTLSYLVASLALINSPLYALDLYRYMRQKFSNNVNSQSTGMEKNLDQQTETENNNGPKSMLLLTMGEIFSETLNQEKGQYTKMFISTQIKTECDNFLEEDNEQYYGL